MRARDKRKNIEDANKRLEESYLKSKGSMSEAYGGLINTSGGRSSLNKKTVSTGGGIDDDDDYDYVSGKNGLSSQQIDSIFSPSKNFSESGYLEINNKQGGIVGYLNTDGFIYDKNKKEKLAIIGKARDSDYYEKEASIFRPDGNGGFTKKITEKIGVLSHEDFGGIDKLTYHFEFDKNDPFK